MTLEAEQAWERVVRILDIIEEVELRLELGEAIEAYGKQCRAEGRRR
jgi:hypothetical protein